MTLPRHILLLLAIAFTVVGCASGPSFSEYSAKQPPAPKGQGRLWFYRPSKFIGAAVQPEVLLNGEKVGKAQPGCFFYVDRMPGTYEAKCSTEWTNKTSLSLAAQEEKFMRLELRPGVFVGHIAPTEVDRTIGLKEIAECKLITADGANSDLRQ